MAIQRFIQAALIRVAASLAVVLVAGAALLLGTSSASAADYPPPPPSGSSISTSSSVDPILMTSPATVTRSTESDSKNALASTGFQVTAAVALGLVLLVGGGIVLSLSRQRRKHS